MPAVKKSTNHIVHLIRTMADLKTQIKTMSDQIKGTPQQSGLESRIIEDFNFKGIKTLSVEQVSDPRTVITATLVEPSRLDLNEDRLRELVGEERWMAVTRRVVDKKLLEDAMATGAITPAEVARCSTEVPSQPHIKITTSQNTNKPTAKAEVKYRVRSEAARRALQEDA